MENVKLPEDVSDEDRALFKAMSDMLVTLLKPLCKAIVDEYLSKLNMSVNP